MHHRAPQCTMAAGLAYHLALTDYRRRNPEADVIPAAHFAELSWPLFHREAAEFVWQWRSGQPCEHATYLRMLAECQEQAGASLPQPSLF